MDHPDETHGRPATVTTQPEVGADGVVLFVVPPFAGAARPALGVSQLKANLQQQGIAAEVLYLNMLFAERISAHIHECITWTWCYSQIGEFIFSNVLHDWPEGHVERYAEQILAGTTVRQELELAYPDVDVAGALRHLIDEARDFIQNEAMVAILDRNPWMVGLTSSFQQNCPSLAVIQEIKRQRPEIVTVMGGNNCKSEMGEELFACYPDIDFVSLGEADRSLVDLVRSLRAGEPGTGIEGFLSRSNGQPPSARLLVREELDALPHPDFDDFFAQLATVTFRDQISPGLVMETSRGCWWGEKQHCTFCGMNADGMTYRSKSPARALEEMSALVERYGVPRIEMADNILDHGYLKALVPQLEAEPIADLFWETKANLSRDQVRMMRRARIRWIQAGIESLSRKTLKLMRKGTSGLQNIQLLKWCAESGIGVGWYWLFGFPGESEDELPRLASIARAASHLKPPDVTTVLGIDRFSPYFYAPEEWGLAPIRPAERYRYVYPFAEQSLQRLAYCFECDFLEAKDKGDGFQQLTEIVSTWRKAFRSSHLVAIPRQKSVILLDTRPGSKRFVRRLTGLRRKIYDYCWKVRGERDVARAIQTEATPEEVSSILRSFVADALMLEEDGRFLSLATDPRHGYKDFPAVFPGPVFLGLRAEQRRRWIRSALSFRVPPWQVASAVWSKLQISVKGKAVAVLSRLLVQEPLGEDAEGPPLAPDLHVDPRAATPSRAVETAGGAG